MCRSGKTAGLKMRKTCLGGFLRLSLLLGSAFLLSGCRNGAADPPGESAAQKGASDESAAGGYEAYSGDWTQEGVSAGAVAVQGGVLLQIDITDQNRVRAELFTQQGVTERFAEIGDITGVIEDGRFSFEFTDDGWGGSGTLLFELLPEQIRITVEDYVMAQENTSGYGISGVYELQRAASGEEAPSDPGQAEGEETPAGPEQAVGEEALAGLGRTEWEEAPSDPGKDGGGLTEEQLQDAVYRRYYAPYEDEEELIAALTQRGPYYKKCPFSDQVQEYLEKVREVTDVGNLVEPLFYTDMRYYSAGDFEECTPLILRLARNEIYARRGYIFKDEDMYNYFYGHLWYEPSVSPEEFDGSVFNEYESANLELLISLESGSASAG